MSPYLVVADGLGKGHGMRTTLMSALLLCEGASGWRSRNSRPGITIWYTRKDLPRVLTNVLLNGVPWVRHLTERSRSRTNLPVE